MLGLRVEGGAAEAHAFLDALRGAGVEVRVGTTKDRGGFAHVYAEIRVPGYEPPAAGQPAADTANSADQRPPYRTHGYIEQPALPAGRRPARRRPR